MGSDTLLVVGTVHPDQKPMLYDGSIPLTYVMEDARFSCRGSLGERYVDLLDRSRSAHLRQSVRYFFFSDDRNTKITKDAHGLDLVPIDINELIHVLAPTYKPGAQLVAMITHLMVFASMPLAYADEKKVVLHYGS